MTCRLSIVSALCLLVAASLLPPAAAWAGGSAEGVVAIPTRVLGPDDQPVPRSSGHQPAAFQCSGASECLKGAMTVPDHTLVERWELGEANPGGEIPYGWFDVVGLEVFNTFQMQASWCGADLVIKLFTNFPESGEGDGTSIGYASGGYWQPADLFFDFDFDGVWDTAVALANHGAIPADPGNPNPPGYGLPADEIVKGGIYTVASWFSSDDIHYYHTGRGGRYDLSSPKVPPVWLRLGSKIGDAQVTWTRLDGTDPSYQIEIVLTGINFNGEWDHFNLLWGTANCANDVIVASTEVEPEIVANYLDGPWYVSLDTPVTVVASLYPGRYKGINASWWLPVQTPYDPPVSWYSLVAGSGWLVGFRPYQIAPLADLPALTVLDSTLSPGAYDFYFGVVVQSSCTPKRFFHDRVTVHVDDIVPVGR